MKDGDPVDDYCVLPGIQNMPGHIWKAGEARPLALVVGWTEVPTGGKKISGGRGCQAHKILLQFFLVTKEGCFQEV